MFDIFEKQESEVRSYCRKFPVSFKRAQNSLVYSVDNERYIDFFAGAGALNFGHNNPYIKNKVIEFLKNDNVIQMLDMYTPTSEDFLKTMKEKYFEPKNLDYKIMHCSPSGTNSVEAALKLARKNKKRTNILAFTGSYHGQSLGGQAVSSGVTSRHSGVPLTNVSFIPYATDLETEEKSLNYFRWILSDDHSGVDKPAAVILETVQGEGGIKIASNEWLQGVRKICDDNDILMIVDEIQSGVYRTGDFFSWERAGIVPDMVCVAKSIGGLGLPISLLFIKSEYDIFGPGEHSGTFRGNQLSLLGCIAAMEYAADNNLDKEVRRKGEIVKEFINDKVLPLDNRLEFRNLGLFCGIDFIGIDYRLAAKTREICFKNNLIIDVCGRDGGVLKILPPLTIEDNVLIEGLEIIEKSIKTVLSSLK
ncbi:diaminobutyrate--2-oxoglutarate transaminase [Bacillota bacterium]